MLHQRQVGILFELFVRAVGAGRYSAVAMPLIVSLIAAAVSMQDVDPVASNADEVLALEAADSSAVAAASSVPASLPAVRPGRATTAQPMAAPGTMPAPQAARARLALSPEQRNVARFVAKKYRVGLDEVQHLVALAYRAAREFRIDPYLVLAVMSIESNFNPDARSPAGAQGLMQVLTRVHVDKFRPFGGAMAAFDPRANISVGSRILKEYLVREGSVEAALKSYVGAATMSHDSGYGYKVLSERERIAAAAAGKPVPAQPLGPPVMTARAVQVATTQAPPGPTQPDDGAADASSSAGGRGTDAAAPAAAPVAAPDLDASVGAGFDAPAGVPATHTANHASDPIAQLLRAAAAI